MIAAALSLQLLSAAAALAPPPSIVRMRDAASGRQILLVGTMHYNPHSVRLVKGAVELAARRRGLQATAIELCPARWNSTAAARWRIKRDEQISYYERLLSEDEFQVAFESSIACGLHDIVLADQPIGLTGKRLGAAFMTTATDLLTPAGWRRLAIDVRAAAASLSAGASVAAFDGRLALGAPLALCRYLYQSPAALPFLAVSTVALGVAAAVDEATAAVATWDDALVSAIVALLVGRAAFVSLIRERDDYLAQSIRRACMIQEEGNAARAGVVVVVLGIAHLAGVRRALEAK